ncbi:MAG: bifunctional demethylmenaquinone methyltransferase/2-methoxy-6-polyprenyl-1,4-benzoquinol methylase UbiE [Anaerolineae bacterium]
MSPPRHAEQAQRIREMFGRIANRYDLMNRLMTFGQDMRWRRFVVSQTALPSGGRLLDLAIGTGDIALAALQRHPGLTVVGVDFSLPMMQVGRQRRLGDAVLWCQGDALALPFPENTFDAVVSGYLLRNLVDLRQGLQEQVRVVRPGGMVVALDTTPPPHTPLRPLIIFHLRRVIPLLGRLVTGEPDAYAYLPDSTQAFKPPQELAAELRGVGLQDVTFRTFMLGTMAVHWGRKPVP